MKLALAQVRSIPGDISANIDHHRKFIQKAAKVNADILFFPELSLSGYEPTLAKQLAMAPDDPRLSQFQDLSKKHQLTIGLGVPLKMPDGITISMLIFRPESHLQIYSKRFLHADEEPFFVPGKNKTVVLEDYPELALAICYELSVPEHTNLAADLGAKLYLASVVKFANGIDQAFQRLATIAQHDHFTVLMVNAVGEADGAVCGGKTGIWAPDGKLIGLLSDQEEGLLLYDTNTQEAQKVK